MVENTVKSSLLCSKKQKETASAEFIGEPDSIGEMFSFYWAKISNRIVYIHTNRKNTSKIYNVCCLYIL